MSCSGPIRLTNEPDKWYQRNSAEGDKVKERTMFEGLFQPMHLLVIFGIALLVFGPKKLPELGRGIGEGIRGFKSAIKPEEDKPATAMSPANSGPVHQKHSSEAEKRAS